MPVDKKYGVNTKTSFYSTRLPSEILLNGSISANEEEIKRYVEYCQSYPKFAIMYKSYGVSDYWIPLAYSMQVYQQLGDMVNTKAFGDKLK